MKGYYTDLDSTVIDLREMILEEALALLRRHGENKGQRELYVGVCRSDADFVEIGWVGHDKYLIHTDRLVKPEGFWKRMFAKHYIDIEVSGRGHAEEILISYFTGTRQDFECGLVQR